MQLIPLGGSLELGQSLWSLGCPELRPGDRTLSHRWISHLMGTAHGRGAGVAHSSAHRGTQLGGDVRQLPRHQGGASPAEGKPPPAPAGHSVAGTRLQSPVYSRCSGGGGGRVPPNERRECGCTGWPAPARLVRAEAEPGTGESDPGRPVDQPVFGGRGAGYTSVVNTPCPALTGCHGRWRSVHTTRCPGEARAGPEGTSEAALIRAPSWGLEPGVFT